MDPAQGAASARTPGTGEGKETVPAIDRQRLADQHAAMLALFELAGFRRIEPPILQPADVFLERSGEAIRARTYLFADPDGAQELCLRPDLTIPTCRYHLAVAADPRREARYCYLGPVFRYHANGDPLYPDESWQAGVEWFGHADAVAADAALFALCLQALGEAGLPRLSLRLGDIGLIRALLADIDMPARWRRRLLMRFRRPEDFRHTLMEMTGEAAAPARSSLSALVDMVVAMEAPDLKAVTRLVERHLAEAGLAPVGGRTPEEIARRLLEKAEDRRAPRLPGEKGQLILSLLEVEGAPEVALAALTRLAGQAGGAFAAALENLERRFSLMAESLGARSADVTFAADFGRAFDYYTGFVFQAEAEIGGRRVPVAGGGRYDDLLASLGGPDAPACGFGIHTERLLMATGGGAA